MQEIVNGQKMTEAQIVAYLDRIGIENAAEVLQKPGTPEMLAALQRAHITHVPFENIDIMDGKELSLNREILFEKVIERRRGGVCSELNTLYNWLLESLGYDVTSFISRIIAKTAPLQANSHRVMMVRFGDVRYITDVGFNFDHHRIPLVLEEDTEQYDGECTYRFSREDILGWVLHQKTAEGWRRKISFTESPQLDLDFVGPTFFAQHSPASRINKALKVSIHKDGVFYAIREGAFLTEEKGIVREIERVETACRQQELLREVFGL